MKNTNSLFSNFVFPFIIKYLSIYRHHNEERSKHTLDYLYNTVILFITHEAMNSIFHRTTRRIRLLQFFSPCLTMMITCVFRSFQLHSIPFILKWNISGAFVPLKSSLGWCFDFSSFTSAGKYKNTKTMIITFSLYLKNRMCNFVQHFNILGRIRSSHFCSGRFLVKRKQFYWLPLFYEFENDTLFVISVFLFLRKK